MAWAYRALLVNEFTSPDFQNVTSHQNQTEGQLALIEGGFTFHNGEAFGKDWIAWGAIYLIFYQLICVVVTGILLQFLRVKKKIISPSRPDTTNFSIIGNIGRQSVRGLIRRRESDQEGDGYHLIEDHDSLVTNGGGGGGGSSSSSNYNNEMNDDDLDLPFTKVDLSFHDICYEVTASQTNEKLKLLKNINGVFRAGRMCALMGSSGAGKTTLMDVIALRKTAGTVEGEVRLNGHLQEPTSFRRCSGYVEQFDVQSPQLTVRETVLFSARLRLDRNNEAFQNTPNLVERYVDKIIKMMELNSEEGLLVGSDEEGGLSFEQTKRLSIAVELAASPSIIFLDEVCCVWLVINENKLL